MYAPPYEFPILPLRGCRHSIVEAGEQNRAALTQDVRKEDLRVKCWPLDVHFTQIADCLGKEFAYRHICGVCRPP